MSASFIQEMTSVQEAFDTWKMGKKTDNIDDESVPSNGVVTTDFLYTHDRLFGEIAYYRRWQESDMMPTISLKSSTDSFNDEFAGDLYGVGNKVIDLYFLDLDKIGYKSNYNYIIDAQNGILYQVEGASINGVNNVHSLVMYRSLKSDGNEIPGFAELFESDGPAGGKKLAGLTDKSDPDYENGFQLIASYSNDNIYKLYNNGELYGKGVKGKLLGTSASEMEDINSSKWKVFEIPSEIPGDNSNRKILPGYDCMFIIDKNKELWGWGSNNNNKFGLGNEEQIEYTEAKPTKLNVKGKEISKVFSLISQTFVVTTDNELYAAGLNTSGQLGVGFSSNGKGEFEKVEFDNPQNILSIVGDSYYQSSIMILTSDNGVYFSGMVTSSKYNSKDGYITKFINIYDGNLGQNIGKNLVNLVFMDSDIYYSLDTDGNVFQLRPRNLDCSKVSIGGTEGKVESIRGIEFTVLATKKIDGETHLYYVENSIYSIHSLLDSDNKSYDYNFKELNPSITKNVDLYNIKDIFIGNCTYILMKDGSVFAKGENSAFGEGISSGDTPNEFRKIQDFSELPLIDSFYISRNSSEFSSSSYVLLKGMDGKLYGINDSNIMFREKKLEKNWKLVAKNVKKFNACTGNNSLAYIDFNNDIWVIGNSAKILGCNPSGDDYELTEFTRLKDKLVGTDVYNNINEKVEDYAMASSGEAFYIKTNELDNNSLYVSGLAYNQGREIKIGVSEDTFIPKKILNNVEKFYCENAEAGSLAITNDSGNRKLYAWGADNWSSIGGNSSVIPKEINLGGLNLENSLLFIGGQMGLIYDGNESVFIAGRVSDNPKIQNGVGKSLGSFTKYSLKDYLDISEDKKLIKVIKCDRFGYNLYQLDDYSLFGLGDQSYLGIGISDGSCADKPISVPTPEKFVAVVGGNRFYVAVTEDGKVYGTGQNVNGVLGRWKGAPRSAGRYRTAFDWVECPELEI